MTVPLDQLEAGRDAPPLQLSTRGVLHILEGLADPHGRVREKLAELAELAGGVHTRTIQTHLRILEGAGYLVRARPAGFHTGPSEITLIARSG